MTLSFKTLYLTALALVAFAANSLLCRLALVDSGAGPSLDPFSFTAIRLVSGALVLWLLLKAKAKQTNNADTSTTTSNPRSLNWLSSSSLFIYAISFSYAYVQLETGTGALILFGSVQITMIVFALVNGHKMSVPEVLGLVLAFAGLVYLMLPNLGTPSFIGFSLMMLSGIAWGIYSLKGAVSDDGLADTTINFIGALPFVLISMLVLLMTAMNYHVTPMGVLYALLSGALASGVGYAIWYAVLPSLTAIQAAALMLLVPVIAAVAGIIFVGESITLRFILSSLLILGGVLLVIFSKRKPNKNES